MTIGADSIHDRSVEVQCICNRNVTDIRRCVCTTDSDLRALSERARISAGSRLARRLSQSMLSESCAPVLAGEQEYRKSSYHTSK